MYTSSSNVALIKRAFLAFALLLFVGMAQSQELDKRTYLEDNSTDLKKLEVFPRNDFKIVGFGALHGSAKTEQAELMLLKSLKGKVRYYLPEVDFATGVYFNHFLQNGNEELLRDLVFHYGFAVEQECAEEVFDKWIALRNWNLSLPEGERLQAAGTNTIASFKYTAMLLVEHLDGKLEVPEIGLLKQMLQDETTQWLTWAGDTPAKQALRKLDVLLFPMVAEQNPLVNQHPELELLLHSLHFEFGKQKREPIVFEMYSLCSAAYDFDQNRPFLRYGFFHLEKALENPHSNYPSLFTMLIDQEVYTKRDVITVMGYLTKSKVLWYTKRSATAEVIRQQNKGPWGVSDSWREHFVGIKALKQSSKSEYTLFDLGGKHSPYTEKTGADLIGLQVPFKKQNGYLKTQATADYIDFALLIRNSPANTALER